jgi:prepilin-type N-terminal cleavage/methylation domain-containing protein
MLDKKIKINKKVCFLKKQAFTLIELLIVVAIIGILAAAIIVNTNQSKKNARINNAKSALKGALLTIISCNDANSAVDPPSGPEIGTRVICASSPKSYWPKLQGGYEYTSGDFTSANCNFEINTNSDTPSGILTCLCSTQRCSY